MQKRIGPTSDDRRARSTHARASASIARSPEVRSSDARRRGEHALAWPEPTSNMVDMPRGSGLRDCVHRPSLSRYPLSLSLSLTLPHPPRGSLSVSWVLRGICVVGDSSSPCVAARARIRASTALRCEFPHTPAVAHSHSLPLVPRSRDSLLLSFPRRKLIRHNHLGARARKTLKNLLFRSTTDRRMRALACTLSYLSPSLLSPRSCEHLSTLPFAQGCEMMTSSAFARVGAVHLDSVRSSPVHTNTHTDYLSESRHCYLTYSVFNGSTSFPEKGLGVCAKEEKRGN